MRPDLAVSRVVQVHTRYRQAGGEDRIVEAERRLFEAAGVSVRQVMFDNAELLEGRSITGDLRLAASAVWSRRAAARVRRAITESRPQVMHVHNTFAAASPSVFAAARGLPVVHTLHNYRMVCPVATCFRDGRACTECVGRVVPWPAVAHSCINGSHAQSAVAGGTVALHRAIGTFSRRIHAYVALTDFQRTVMVDGGVPADRVHVIPNFLEPDPGVLAGERTGTLFAGRLSPEKGVEVLLRAAASAPNTIRIAGSGPMQADVEVVQAGGGVEYLGALKPSEVLRELRRCVALVLPSIWFEGFPVAVIEAYATGTPVIASRIGSLAEIVVDGVTGLLVRPHDADDLSSRVRWALEHPDEMREMGANARREYERRFRGEAHLAALLAVFRAAAEQRHRARAQ